MEFNINIFAVLTAVVVNFVFGFIWYTPMFGKIWGREMGDDSSVIPPRAKCLKVWPLLLSVIFNGLGISKQ